jgi:porin
MGSAIRVKTRGCVIFCACMLFTTASRAAEWESATIEDAVSHVFNRRSSWIELASYQCSPGVGCDEGCLPGDCSGALTGAGCCSDFCTRPTLTNGFGGLQPALAGRGITYDAQLTHFYQGVARGGNNQLFKYGGKLDQFLILDSKQMGLWEGAQMIMHAETRFGEDVILDAAGLAPVNANLLYPTLDNDTAITGLLFQQALSEEWAVSFGKFNTLDLFNLLYPQTGRGITGFMNASIFLPLSVARTVPLSMLGAGLMKLHEGQVQGSLMVYDSNNTPTTSGFNTLFNNGANVLGLWRIFTNLGGLPGSHAVMGTWAAGNFTTLDRTGWSFEPGVGIVAGQQSNSWSVEYILDQKLWIDGQNTDRNIGLLSQWGYADPKTCPYQWTGNVAVQAQGLMPARAADTMGAGWFYSGLSNDLQNLVSPLLPLRDLWGVELYYNAAVTPWFHLTGDLQVVRPGVQANDTAVVVGLRGWMHL